MKSCFKSALLHFEHPQKAMMDYSSLNVYCSSSQLSSQIILFPHHTGGSTAKIRAAMDEWEKYTCIRFQYRNNTIDKKYVLFRTKFDKDGKMMGM